VGYGSRDAAHQEKLIARCAAALQEKLRELASQDEQSQEIEALRAKAEQLEAECEKYQKALEEANRRDGVKAALEGKRAKAVRVPVTDSDSTILPNKEGGFAPNYTAVAAVEAASGAIISSQIMPGNEEGSSVAKALEDFREITGQEPERVLGDSGFAAGENLQKIEQAGAASYMPVCRVKDNPARRGDPAQPVAEELLAKLPYTGKHFSQEAFVYDREKDIYHCPMGKSLNYARQGKTTRTGIAYRAYGCPGKAGCPLADRCIKGKAKWRLVRRDQYQDVRDRTALRMASEEGKAIYARRAPVAEGVFGTVKQAMGIRQFLLRGLAKVAMEWTWITSAYNLRKLLGVFSKNTATDPKGGKKPGKEDVGANLHVFQRPRIVFIPCPGARSIKEHIPRPLIAA
jgi:hypothetical protein